MKGYVAKKENRWYAVIYDGHDPITGREHRIWHPAGTDRAEAEKLAARLAAAVNGRNDDRGLSFGAYLTTRWLPGKRLVLAASTWDGYRPQRRPRHPRPPPARHQVGGPHLDRRRVGGLPRCSADPAPVPGPAPHCPHRHAPR